MAIDAIPEIFIDSVFQKNNEIVVEESLKHLSKPGIYQKEDRFFIYSMASTYTSAVFYT
ncbi:MAG: hypothetical protein K8Q97_01470 [Candidatus Andersenbacteria bacterium]|nr:hypothetical protein [Candidatus Andersenbacteria bacterium]